MAIQQKPTRLNDNSMRLLVTLALLLMCLCVVAEGARSSSTFGRKNPQPAGVVSADSVASAQKTNNLTASVYPANKLPNRRTPITVPPSSTTTTTTTTAPPPVATTTTTTARPAPVTPATVPLVPSTIAPVTRLHRAATSPTSVPPTSTTTARPPTVKTTTTRTPSTTATTTESSPTVSSTTPHDTTDSNDPEYDDDFRPERSDEYIYDLMESLMMTIHEKLRRAETLENTCRNMLDKMAARLDTMEDKFDYHNNRIDVAVSKLRSIDSKLPQMGDSPATIDVRLQTLGSKVDVLGAKLSELKDDFVRDKRGAALVAAAAARSAAAGVSTAHHHHHHNQHDSEADLAAQSSERRDFFKDPRSGRTVMHQRQMLQQPAPLPAAQEDAQHSEENDRVSRDLESVKESLTSLDARLQGWMQQVSATANGIAQTIGDLHDAIMEPPQMVDRRVMAAAAAPPSRADDGNATASDDPLDGGDLDASASDSATDSGNNNNVEEPLPEGGAAGPFVTFRQETKLDKLFRKIHPIVRATERMDEMWNVVLGTQRLVDDSLHKSDQLLTNSYRQVQSLSDVKSYLQHQTGKIMRNLEQVEEWLKEQGAAAAANSASIDSHPRVIQLTQGIREILNKTAQFKELHAQLNDKSFPPISRPSHSASASVVAAASVAEPRYFPDDDAYHRDTEYAHGRQKLDEQQPPPMLPDLKSGAGGSAGLAAPTTDFKQRKLTMTAVRNNANNNAISAAAANSSGGSGNGSLSDTCPMQGPQGVNCADLRERGVVKSGVYYILIKGTTYWFMKVYCDMETDGGGWTVIQSRDDFGLPRENFIRDWNDYKNGFGDMKREFWLGNENVFMLTNQEDYTLRIELEDFDKHKRHAIYTKFKIYSEAENYKLEIGGYEGNAGDSLNDPWYGSNLNPFSTYDRDNDRSSLNCASMLRGGWWWRSCGRGLNGIYLTNPTDLAARQGIVWFRWRGWDYTLKKSHMLIRPKSFTVPAPIKG